MRPKFLCIWCAILCTAFLFSQKKFTFGELSAEDLAFTSFAGDKDAHAVVLLDQGDYYFDIIRDRILLVKEYHSKIKILD